MHPCLARDGLRDIQTGTGQGTLGSALGCAAPPAEGSRAGRCFEGCCRRWWCSLPPVRCSGGGGVEDGEELLSGPAPGPEGVTWGASSAAAREERPWPGCGSGRAGCGLQRAAAPRAPPGGAALCPSPRALWGGLCLCAGLRDTETASAAAGTQSPCSRAVPALGALAHADTGPCQRTHARTRPHSRVPRTARGGAGAGVPALPRVSGPRAQFPPHCACPTALARSQRLDTPRRQAGPPR